MSFLESNNWYMTDMETYHIDQVLPLEESIKQFQRNLLNLEQRKQIFRQFIDWHKQNMAINKIVATNEHRLIGYYILLTTEQSISTFYDHPQLQNCSYLAQIAVSSDISGLGLGSFLLNDLEQLSLRLGKQRVILEVNSQSAAFPWYQHKKYQEIGAQIFMQKEL